MIKKTTLGLALVFSLIGCQPIQGINQEEGASQAQAQATESKPEPEETFYEPSPEELEVRAREEEQGAQLGRVKAMDLSVEDLHSKNYCLMDLESGSVLKAHKEDEVVYPASLTKIMTCLVAIEECKDPSASFILEQETYDLLIEADASMAGFLPGEEVAFEDLLYGTMMPSGADASIGLAKVSSGSVDEHLENMNRKAQDLGLDNTHFATVTGLHHKDNYSTARDMADLLRKAMENEVFARIITKRYHSSQPSKDHPQGIDMEYKVVAYAEKEGVDSYEILGGKTGFTEEAGICLASLARINGIDYILVTLGAEDRYDHFIDALTIYDKIYQNTDQVDG